jgi:hypothetical protein
LSQKNLITRKVQSVGQHLIENDNYCIRTHICAFELKKKKKKKRDVEPHQIDLFSFLSVCSIRITNEKYRQEEIVILI